MEKGGRGLLDDERAGHVRRMDVALEEVLAGIQRGTLKVSLLAGKAT